jgi:hypothetical protein
MRFTRVMSAFAFSLLLPLAIAAPGASAVIPLPLSSQPAGQPAYDMDVDVGVGTGGCCLPVPNPFLNGTSLNPTGALSVITPAGAGVQFDTISTTYNCCSCIRVGTSIPLIDPTSSSRVTLNMMANTPYLQGYAKFDSNPADFFSVPSFGIELVNDGIVMQSVLFTAETAYYPAIVPNNNCATAFNLTNFIFTGGVVTSGTFSIQLAAIPGIQNIDFDEVRVYLMGYGCGPTQGSTVVVGGLELGY